MEHVSAVSWNGRTWFARHTRQPGSPHSSLTQLVQGLYQTHTGARFILRKRILTTEEMIPMNRGMVKTAAQRATTVPALEVQPDWIPVSFTNNYRIVKVSGDAVQAARELAGRARRTGELYQRDRPVACVLIGPDGALLGGAGNTSADNRTCHAEVNLLQTIGRVPEGSTLVTTLEPCRMCQGMILAVDPRMKVRYLESDQQPEVPWKIDSCLHV